MDEKPYISLVTAAKQCPSRPSANAVWRWCRRGVLSRSGQRVYLKHYRVGRKIFTTKEDLHHFFEALAAADRVHFHQTPSGQVAAEIHFSPQHRDKRIQDAEKILSDAGI